MNANEKIDAIKKVLKDYEDSPAGEVYDCQEIALNSIFKIIQAKNEHLKIVIRHIEGDFLFTASCDMDVIMIENTGYKEDAVLLKGDVLLDSRAYDVQNLYFEHDVNNTLYSYIEKQIVTLKIKQLKADIETSQNAKNKIIENQTGMTVNLKLYEQRLKDMKPT